MGNSENPTLLQSCPVFVNDIPYGEELIPGTTLVAHIPWEKWTTLAIYDMARCRNVFERDIGINIQTINAGKEELVIKGIMKAMKYALDVIKAL